MVVNGVSQIMLIEKVLIHAQGRTICYLSRNVSAHKSRNNPLGMASHEQSDEHLSLGSAVVVDELVRVSVIPV
jgi:hypothetical protein